jgi:hypothetical protein
MNATFNNIMVVNFIDGANWNTQEKTTDLPQETYTVHFITLWVMDMVLTVTFNNISAIS